MQTSLPRPNSALKSLGQTPGVRASHPSTILPQADADRFLRNLAPAVQQWFVIYHRAPHHHSLWKSCQGVWTNLRDNLKGFFGLAGGMCFFKCNTSPIPEGPVWISWTYLALQILPRREDVTRELTDGRVLAGFPWEPAFLVTVLWNLPLSSATFDLLVFSSPTTIFQSLVLSPSEAYIYYVIHSRYFSFSLTWSTAARVVLPSV